MRDKSTAAIAGAIGALVAVGIMGAAGIGKSSNVIRAERFEVVDAAGKVRAVLAVDKDGPGLAILDSDGKARVELGLFADGSLLLLENAAGVPKVRIAANDVENGSLTLWGGTSNIFASLGESTFSDSPNRNILLMLSSGGSTASLRVGPPNQAAGNPGTYLSLEDAEHYSAHLGCALMRNPGIGGSHLTSAASLTLWGPDGLIYQAPVQ